MTMIYIREACDNVIRFADDSSENNNAVRIFKTEHDVFIEDKDESCSTVISSKEDAENLIKALQKAIELNWWKE